MVRCSPLAAVAVAAVLLAPTAGRADFIRPNAGFTSNTLAANDDGSTGAVGLSFAVNFFGSTYNSLFVNNNGNVTFNAPLGTFTPFNLNTTSVPILAPFFADVDTRGPGSGVVTYGADTVDGRAAFGVNWLDVGYFAGRTDKLNRFQLVLVDRGDTGAGNYDIEFNYGQIQWEAGQASGGVNGLGGSTARAGYANGTQTPGTFFELTGSAVAGAFLDGGPNALRDGSNVGNPGQFVFEVRNGQVSPSVPAPPAVGLALVGLLPALARRLRRA